MKTSKCSFLFLVFLSMILTINMVSAQEANNESIQWMSWEEAMAANEKEPRKKFIDVYTDWCGWCKKMDATTFQDPEVIQYLNESFYAIKFNAEQKGEITYNDFTFKYVDNGKRGYHQLAQSLLDGRLGYPSFVLIDEQGTRIMLSPGYKTADKVLLELKYAKEEKYKEQSFNKFKQSQSQ